MTQSHYIVTNMNLILAIDTSCDETSAAVTCGRRVLSNVISSQVNLHKKYGGVYPALAKRAHEERIDPVVKEAIRRAKKTLKCEAGSGKLDNEVRSKNHEIPLPASNSNFPHLSSNFQISAVAVTQGPGLAIALEVGIRKAKEIIERSKEARKQGSKDKKISETLKLCFSEPLRLVSINHLEGHIYSTLAQNSQGRPQREIIFPALCLLVSGGHTELVLMKNLGEYRVLGATLDDACGEALDKAAKILKLGYPGGPVIERLAEKQMSFRKHEALSGIYKNICIDSRFRGNDETTHRKQATSKIVLTPPLTDKSNLNFSYSGLKTQFLYLVEKMSEKDLGKNLHHLAFAFQEAAFEQLIRKTSQAITMYQPKTLLCGGGVIANKYLRKLLRRLAKKNNLPIFFPPYKNLITDNAAMVGIAAWYKLQRGEFVKDINFLDREPRLSL